MVNNLPETGGLKEKIEGTKDLESFATGMKPIGEAIVAFSDTVKDKISAKDVEVAANAGKTLSELIKNLPTTNVIKEKLGYNEGTSNFKSDLENIGEAIVAFSGKVSGGKKAEE